MATTDISTEIVSITGVTAHGASDEFIVSAQKFVVASVPKELLPFAVNRSSSSNDGSAIPIENDSIVDVQRNEYSCRQISLSESKWANDTTSLKKSTAISPVYWIKNDGVQIAPDTDGSNLGYVFYVNYAEIDDDSDLRDAVVYRACSSEYSKLATAAIPTVSIAAVPPDVPTLSASAVSFGTTAPAYTKPSLTSRVAFQSYWTLSDFGDSDPGVLTISVSAPGTPSDPSISSPGVNSPDVASLPTAPDYAPPTVGGAAESLTATMTAGTAGTDADQIDYSDWWEVLADMIEDEEDTELAVAQIQKINSYIGAYQAAVQDSLNTFNEKNAVYQAGLQKNLEQARIDTQDAQKEGDLTLQAAIQDYSLELQLFQGEVSKYQAQVSDEVQEYSQKLARYQLELNTVYTAWAKTESDSLSQYQADIQNELNEFNKETTEYQAQLQVSMQNASFDNEEDARKLAKYQAELQQYASEVQSEVSEYQSKMQKSQILEKEADKYYQWSVNCVTMYIQNNSKMIAATMASRGAQA